MFMRVISLLNNMQACSYPIHILLLIFSSLTKMKCQKKYKKLIKSSVTGNCLLLHFKKMSVTLQGLTTYANDFSSTYLTAPTKSSNSINQRS